MTSALYRWQIWCIEENAFILTHGYQEKAPVACPNSVNHLVDLSKVQIVDSTLTNQVNSVINKERTGGNWQNKSWQYTFEPGTSTQTFPSFPRPVRLSRIKMLPRAENVGDKIDVVTTNDIMVGASITGASTGDNWLYVTDDVVNNVFSGYIIGISEGPTGPIQEMGEICDITGNYLNFEYGLSGSYPSGSPVYMRIKFIEDIFFPNEQNQVLGELQGETLFLSPNFSYPITYTNVGTTGHTLTINLEYYY